MFRKSVVFQSVTISGGRLPSFSSECTRTWEFGISAAIFLAIAQVNSLSSPTMLNKDLQAGFASTAVLTRVAAIRATSAISSALDDVCPAVG